MAEKQAMEYRSATPFPHILIEDFIDSPLINQIADAAPNPEAKLNWRFNYTEKHGEKAQYNKLGTSDQLQFPPVIQQLIWEMNAGPFIRFLEQLTGIDALLPDPRLHGGGIHLILPKGVLGVHADFTQHAEYGFNRRLNAFVYLNRDWRPEYGGHLELWSRDMKRCERRIMPSIGRCVIFNTDASSYHGHPEPVACPEGVARKSIALYYYTTSRADGVLPTQETNFQKLPNNKRPPLE